MKKGEKKKQRKALKKHRKAKLARSAARPISSRGAPRRIRQARSFPIDGCWTRSDWREHGVTVVVIARRQPDGKITFGNYLVDLYCLGLKNTFADMDVPQREFRRRHLKESFPDGKPIEITPALAHEIIYGSIEYARQFGFRPHRDFKYSERVLDPPDYHPRSGEVEFGKDGLPFFAAGPYDNAQAIIRKLMRTAGEGNFHYLAPICPIAGAWLG